MARLKKHSIAWTVCYAYPIGDDDFFTGSWFAFGRSKEEAKESFFRNWDVDDEFLGVSADIVTVVNVVEGFSC